MSKKIKILSVKIEHKADECPDSSYLGEFTDTPNPLAFIRTGEHTGKLVSELGEDDELPGKSREYRFFLPATTGEQTGNPESPRQDWQRMESLNNGQWGFIGVIAKAEIQMPSGTVQTIRSSGLWGVESDSGDQLKQIAREQLDELREELIALGIGDRAITYAFNQVEI